MMFDEISMRRWFVEEGGIEFIRRPPKPGKPAGNYGITCVSSIVTAWLLGLYDETVNTLDLAIDWLSEGIEKREDFGPEQNYHQATMHSARAIALWMRDNEDSTDDWNAAAICLGKSIALDGDSVSEASRKSYLENVCPFIAMGAGIDAAMGELLKFSGSSGVAKKSPLSIISYLAENAQGGSEYGDLPPLIESILRAHMEKVWVAKGQMIRAAGWLRLIYSHPNGLCKFTMESPLDTVMRARSLMI